MLEHRIVPNSSFNFHDWCYGYIFSQLYQINKQEYANSFYMKDNGTAWFICTRFTYPANTKPKDQFHISATYYEYNNNNTLKIVSDPADTIQKNVIESVNHYLGLQDDLTMFYKVVDEFPELAGLKNILPGYRLSSVLLKEWMPVFAYLSTNTTVDMFHTFLENFLISWGKNLIHEKFVIPSFPLLSDMNSLQDEDYRKTKVGYRSKYLPQMMKDLQSSSFPIDYDNYKVGQEDTKKLLKQLKKVKGVGDYSARCILLYGLKDYSIGFVDSFIKIIMNHYFKTDLKIANNELLKIIDSKFGQYQGLMIDWLCAVYSYKNKTSKDKFFKAQKTA